MQENHKIYRGGDRVQLRNTLMKKGQNMGWLQASAIGFIILVVVVGIGASVIGDMQGDNETVEEGEVYEEGQDGFAKFSGKFTLIASIIILVFVLGLLGMLYMRGR